MGIGLGCDVCGESFNETIRLPKLLPCQHTYCLDCLFAISSDGNITCPMDKKVFAVGVASDLPDNLYITTRLKSASGDDEGSRKRFKSSAESVAEVVGDTLQLQLLASLSERRKVLVATLQERLELEELLLKRARACEKGLRKEQQTSARTQELRREAATLLHAGAALEQDVQILQARLDSASAKAGWRSKLVQLSKDPALQVAAQAPRRRRDSVKSKSSQQEQRQEGSSRELEAQQELPIPRQRLDVSRFGRPLEEWEVKKMQFLSLTSPIHMLTRVGCPGSDGFAMALLQKHAAHLEEVHLFKPTLPHLLAVLGMRGLRKLQVIEVHNKAVGALPQGLEVAGGGLTWLQLLSVPRDTAGSLITANRHSLRKLRLGVGLPCTQPEACVEDLANPNLLLSSKDLKDFLRDCRLQRLEGLTLVRQTGCTYSYRCESQLTAARRVLPPNCRVRCNLCRVWVDGEY